MRKGCMAAQEKKWRAESDAETLARAAEIKGDKGRLAAAQKVATEKAKQYQAAVGDSLGFAKKR